MSWQEGDKALGFTNTHNPCCCLEQVWFVGKYQPCAVTPPRAPSGYWGLCSRSPRECPPPSPSVCPPYGQQAGQNRSEHLFFSSTENNFENESREAEPETLSCSFLTFQIGNSSLSSVPGHQAICISRGQDVAIPFYRLKIVIKSLFGNKTTHAWKDGLCRLQLTAPVIPDFPGCCWRMLKRGGTGTAGGGTVQNHELLCRAGAAPAMGDLPGQGGQGCPLGFGEAFPPAATHKLGSGKGTAGRITQ